ncbi:hypothetical protein OG203_24625 [Nocardia sp. NBC_01499]|uniref:hypothetical protein n=1 Tax=Nocardia sp. NBC_01499 TaxID=2903597 RepID=UPI00386E2384
MNNLARADAEGDPLTILKTLRTRLIGALDDAPPGVIPQLAKQIADLTIRIADISPAAVDRTEIDDFHDAFNAALSYDEQQIQQNGNAQ